MKNKSARAQDEMGIEIQKSGSYLFRLSSQSKRLQSIDIYCLS